MMLFPNFSVRSVTFIYSMLLILVFLITEIVYAANKATLTWYCVLYYSGGKFTYDISRKGQVHRLLLPIILHSGFFHIFWNLLSLYMIGFSIEKAYGYRKYIALIIFGGIGGNLVSAVIDPYSLGVGASTSLFAIIGALIVWYIYNWNVLGPMRTQYAIFMFIIIAFTLLNGLLMGGTGIDNWGHLGGLIFGILIALILLNRPETDAKGIIR